MENSPISQSIVSKIQKLLALGKSSNINEAAAAMARAQEMLLKHKISMADIDLTKDEPTEKVDRMFIDEPTRLQLRWKTDLFHAVARGFFCRGLNSTGGTVRAVGIMRMTLIGKPSDMATAQYVYQYLRNEVERLAKEQSAGRGFAWANSFRIGAVWELGARLQRQNEERRRAASAGAGAAPGGQLAAAAAEASTALAVIDRAAADNDAYVATVYPKLAKPAKAVRVSTASAYFAGKAAAEKIALPGGQREIGSAPKAIR